LEDLLNNVKEMALLDIMSGRQGVEWIIIDPNWKLMWKETGMATVIRAERKTDRQTDTRVEPVDELVPVTEFNDRINSLLEYNNGSPQPPPPTPSPPPGETCETLPGPSLP